MTRKPFSTDGFVIPRRQRQESSARLDTVNTSPHASLPQPQAAPVLGSQPAIRTAQSGATLPPLDLPESSKDKKKKRRFGLRKPSRRAVKWTLITLLVLLLVGAGYFAYKFFMTGNQIFKGNPLNAILAQGKELKMDENGRTNILIFGTSEDDPGHDGADLTDSMMVVSINQKTKDAFMFSIPRDLYVDYGVACPSGYKGKINVVYLCHKDEGEDAGQTALRDKVGEVFGLSMQYSVHINYTVLREAVDAVGGITVTIESKDPRGILDRNFDWDCPNGNQTCYNVKYPNGPVNLNGKQALYLARARGADPLGRTYGLAQANFDREVYQRKILVALKDKAASAGTLANPVAVNNLLNALGNNVRTNFEAEEIKTLVKLGQDIKNEDIRSLSLVDPQRPLVTTGNVNGESVVKPSAGLLSYGRIQEVIKAYALNDVAFLEGATIAVLNASGQPGKAQTQADELKKNGLTVKITSNAPESANTAEIQLIDQSGGKKPQTLKKLEDVLKTKATATVPAGVGAEADFIIIVGGTAPTSSEQ